MTDEKKIEQLLMTFYNGDTTSEEETLLLTFFSHENLDEKWHNDRDIFHALYNPADIPLPKGFSKRLENSIDNHIRKKVQTKSKSFSNTRRLFIGISSAAAVIVFCISLFFYTNKNPQPQMIADTFTNPEEAAIAAEQVLVLVSSKLNKGLVPLEKVKESINKTNELLNESFK